MMSRVPRVPKRVIIVLAATIVFFIGLAFSSFYAFLFGPDPMVSVDSWAISTSEKEYSIDEPIEYTGVFICSEEMRKENPMLEFSTRMFTADEGPTLDILRPITVPVEASVVCGDGTPVPFEHTWQKVGEIRQQIEEWGLPRQVAVNFTVEVLGEGEWTIGSATTNVFTLHPEEGS